MVGLIETPSPTIMVQRKMGCVQDGPCPGGEFLGGAEGAGQGYLKTLTG